MVSRSFFNKFSSYDIVLISVLSGLGLAIKPVVTPVVHLISVPLMIPGGSLAGGFYMMWLSLGGALVNKFGSMFLIAFVQSIAVIILGFFGNHGVVSVITYSIPGIVAEISGLLFKNRRTLVAQTFICASANLSGALIVTTLIMRLTFIPILISSVTAVISGILGGIAAHKIISKLESHKIISHE